MVSNGGRRHGGLRGSSPPPPPPPVATTITGTPGTGTVSPGQTVLLVAVVSHIFVGGQAALSGLAFAGVSSRH